MNRVTPLKEIPRLELMAALVAARMVQHITEAIPVKKIVCWSDSQIFLHWLNTGKQLNRFNANRKKEIKSVMGDIALQMKTRQICKHEGSQRINCKAALYGYTDQVGFAANSHDNHGNLMSLPPSLP
ncbi:hypothetical protein DPMN_130753 [Dreissena polymorpha]|uniref:Uncharacterized protein n=1 Tax=Dreissena polymorpha TaxID=45954 RepID=A0A9D4JXV0_DREPO|nr:hypothetical protein DPMN_130753 [Dreissena polymorpha]